MDRIDRLWAHEEIRQLVARYALAVDSRDLDRLVELFVEDVRVGRDGQGREALRTAFDASLRSVGISILHVGTHVIELIDDQHATGQVYCHGEIQDGTRWIRQAILYRDTYEKRKDRWFFVRRLHDLWYGAEVGTNPLTLPPANWPEHHEGLGTVPECWGSWKQFWARGEGS